MNRRLRVACIPQREAYDGNPYWEVLQAKLEQRNVKFDSTHDRLYLQWRWLVQNRGRVQVLHFHHLRHHYASGDKTASYLLLLRFIGKLALSRALKFRIVWTVHNLRPHDRVRPHIVGYLAHLALSTLAHAVLVHCQAAKRSIGRLYLRRRQVFVVPHPHYIGTYPNELERSEARSELGIPSHSRVLLFLGALRRYKGVGRLISEFRSIPSDTARLIVAGKTWDGTLLSELEQEAGYDERVVLRTGFVANHDLQLYFNAADAVVLPYQEVLSSGSAVLAMSFGKPVIAPSMGCLPELISEEAGILYDASNPDGLRAALKQAMQDDLETLGHKAAARARQFTWTELVDATLQAYGA